jgi:asparagine synthase (glutamine-hydrolysing)
MCDAIAHRGPDDAGTWLGRSARVALGHRRLSIVDLTSSGHQPMSNEDGTVWLSFNGEIYNHGELRRELTASGHRFASDTDSESIVHLYEEQGPACVERLEGMFAFALWDERAGLLLLARDRLGVKPLYLARRPGGIVFASEVKALLTHPSVDAAPDAAAIAECLCFGAIRAPRTSFAGVEKLAPAERMVVTLDGSVRRERYWTPSMCSASIRGASERELEEQLLVHLRRSVRMRLMSDVPVGVFLSGGLDSSMIVALVSEASHERLKTFSVSPEGPSRYDESRYAQIVADAFGTEHHSLRMTEADFIAELPKVVYHHDEPVADWSCVPSYLLAGLARDQGTIVIQLGEGSDELFGGYNEWRLRPRLLDGLARTPRWLRASVLAPAFGAAARRGTLPNPQLATLHDVALSGVGYWGGGLSLRPLLLEQVASPQAMADARAVARALPTPPGADLMQRLSTVELEHRLPEMLLTRVDKMLMAKGVEGREPFLDQHMVEFALQLPPRLKRRGPEGKVLLRRAVSGLLPAPILERRKQGFSTPVPEWLRGELGRRLRPFSQRSAFADSGLVDQCAVSTMWDLHLAGADWAPQLWQLSMLALWHATWIEGNAGAVQEGFETAVRTR